MFKVRFNGWTFTSVESSPSEHRFLCLEVRPLVLSFTYISSLIFSQYPAKVHGIIRYVLHTRWDHKIWAEECWLAQGHTAKEVSEPWFKLWSPDPVLQKPREHWLNQERGPQRGIPCKFNQKMYGVLEKESVQIFMEKHKRFKQIETYCVWMKDSTLKKFTFRFNLVS